MFGFAVAAGALRMVVQVDRWKGVGERAIEVDDQHAVGATITVPSATTGVPLTKDTCGATQRRKKVGERPTLLPRDP